MKYLSRRSQRMRRLRFKLILFFDLDDEINRRAHVESVLLGHAGRNESMSPDRCLQLAIGLGVPGWVGQANQKKAARDPARNS